MGNLCDKSKGPDLGLSKIGAKSSLQLPRQSTEKKPNEFHETPTPQGPEIKLLVSAVPDIPIEEGGENGDNNKKRISTSSMGSCSSLSSAGSPGRKRKNLTIQDFSIDRPLGKGAFGQVYLVTKKDTERKYAMKTIKKLDMMKMQLIESTILEKTILLRSSHPFVVSLKYCVQTEKKIYLMMEYIKGGEVFTLLKHLGQFTEKVAKFLIAEIILGIQYLHETLKIIYRDLKPENILLTKNGHVKISDFGLSKEFQNKDDKTYTFAGTPEYMAPEVVLNKGHNKNVDLWGLGIFMYELVAGYPPFQDKKRNIEKIQKQIIMNRPEFPENFSPNLKDLIRGFLNSDPSKRLGADSFDPIKEHPFFYDINWDALVNLKIESPIKKYTEQEKPVKAVRPRPIQETPMSSSIQLPQINGMTYNNEEQFQEGNNEDPLLSDHFDCDSPKEEKGKNKRVQ